MSHARRIDYRKLLVATLRHFIEREGVSHLDEDGIEGLSNPENAALLEALIEADEHTTPYWRRKLRLAVRRFQT